MIKIHNGIATRDPIPDFLIGLDAESLADLSWVGPEAGVQDCAWLPEIDQSQPLGQYERYGAETLTVGDGVVIVTREVVPWSAEEIATYKKSLVPKQVFMRQARLALLASGLLDDVEAVISASGRAAQIEWDTASTVERNHPVVAIVQQQQSMTDEDIDALFIAAEKL